MLAGATGLRAAESWDTLLQNSPFGAGAPVAPATATPAGAPEFRGYFSEGGEQFFSIYDPARNRSVWLQQNETSDAFTVRRFDTGAQVLNVEFAGNVFSLSLKQAMVRTNAQVAGTGATAASSTDIRATEEVPAEARQAQAALEETRRIIAERRQRLQAKAANKR